MPPELPLPEGTVTFLFSDIEGSTRLVERLGAARWAPVLARHGEIIRGAVARSEGQVIQTEGDSFFVVFRSATAAVDAAVAAQRALAAAAWPDGASVRVRMGLHTGEGILAIGGDYVGLDVHRAARVAAAGHGGQILLSATTRALVEADLPSDVVLRDLGEHRLKDLSQRVRIADLVVEGLPSEFPPLRTLNAIPNNLPTQLTSFLGRAREMDEIIRLLPAARLLTLTGPGGTGKTRLALQVAAGVVDRYPDGVFFVPLAAISDPEFVAGTIAQELGVAERGGREPATRIVEHLGDRRVLLLLDNFEQVVEAAPVVSEILAGARGTSALVTSRSPLRLYGEREYAVPPLSVPDARRLPPLDTLTQYEAVALFAARAAAVRPDFSITADNAPALVEICRRLDGLPLALELAAARVRLLSPQAILARLGSRLDMLSGGARDLPDRQRTLRGAIGWSHDLLDAPQRTLFACLSVFVGGGALEEIEAVVGPELEGHVLDVLEALVAESLVRQSEAADGQPRFWMLETIREYSTERLAESGRADAVRRRHAEEYLRIAEAARSRMMASDKRDWLDRLELEHDNVRAALGWAIEAGDAEVALRYLVSLWRFWQFRGYLTEGLARAREVLALPGCPDYADLRLEALEAAGGLAYWSGQVDDARRFYAEALELQRVHGDDGGVANAAYNLAFTHLYGALPDFDRARELSEEALERFRRAGDRHGEARGLWALANVEFRLFDARGQREHAAAALRIFRELDDRFLTAWSLYTLATAVLLEPDPSPQALAESNRQAREALRIFAEVGDVSGYTLILDGMAALASVIGDRRRAARLSGVVATLERTSGTGLNPVNREIYNFTPDSFRSAPDTAAAFAEGEAMEIGEAIRYALGPTAPEAADGDRSG